MGILLIPYKWRRVCQCTQVSNDSFNILLLKQSNKHLIIIIIIIIIINMESKDTNKEIIT